MSSQSLSSPLQPDPSSPQPLIQKSTTSTSTNTTPQHQWSPLLPDPLLDPQLQGTTLPTLTLDSKGKSHQMNNSQFFVTLAHLVDGPELDPQHWLTLLKEYHKQDSRFQLQSAVIVIEDHSIGPPVQLTGDLPRTQYHVHMYIRLKDQLRIRVLDLAPMFRQVFAIPDTRNMKIRFVNNIKNLMVYLTKSPSTLPAYIS